MWWPLIAAVLIHFVIVQPAQGYSRFGGNGDELRYVKGIPLSINDQILRGSNIHYYGRFRDEINFRFLNYCHTTELDEIYTVSIEHHYGIAQEATIRNSK